MGCDDNRMSNSILAAAGYLLLFFIPLPKSFKTEDYLVGNVVPTGRVIATVSIKVPTGRYIVPAGYIVPTGRTN
ncbi:hypothetical protein Tco_0849127 [Tanacetum coccineum]